MRPLALLLLAACVSSGASSGTGAAPGAAPGIAPGTPMTPGGWPMHALDRPQPAGVGTAPVPSPAPAPSDAILLFNGTSLDAWEMEDGAPAKWVVRDGYVEVAPGTGTLRTKQGFGDVQLHIEWMSPAPPKGTGQDRGNSGVFLMGRYEVQVLDSWDNRTYPDGQAGAVYGQFPPLANASRRPGEWQAYDIVFRAPRFDAAGAVTSRARLTVLHNGVLVQDAVELVGPTSNRERAPYEAHEARLPLSLQDHDHPVRFRNVWVRELAPLPAR